MKKESVLELIRNMPDQIDIEALLERLIFMAKVEEGLKDAEEGRTISHEDLTKESLQW